MPERSPSSRSPDSRTDRRWSWMIGPLGPRPIGSGSRRPGPFASSLRQKELGIMPSVRVPLEVLRARGMRLSNDVWREVLSMADE
jgi:hypothetical protein